jgi:branched-chain amino acid transport system substrate-binding protein
MFGLFRRCARGVFASLMVCGTALAQDTLTIGQVAPLSGVLATTGQQMVVGGKVYFDWVNDHGGVHGAKIKTIVLDDGYKVDETLRHTKDLVARPEVLALFGFAGSANVGKLLEDQVLANAGIALVAPYTGGELLRTPFNPWIFHVRAGYADETEHMVKQLVTQGVGRIAVVYQNDAFGKSGLAGVESALQRRGQKLVASASYERNTAKVEQAVKVILAAHPQAVIMVAINKPAAAFMRAYRQAGGGGQLFNISVVDPAELVKEGGLENVRGLGISQVVPYPYRRSLPVVREFHEALKKYAPKEEVNYTNFEEYLGAKVLVEALRRAGPKPTRAKVISALESINNFDLGGMRISFGPKERVGSRFVEVTVIDSRGKLLK